MEWLIFLSVAVLVVLFLRSFLVSAGPDVSQDQLLEWMKDPSDVFILDVRSSAEYAEGHIPGAVNIHFRKLDKHLDELAPHKDKKIVVYCQLGPRARLAQRTLSKAGFENVYHLKGDMGAWHRAGHPIQKPE